MNKARSKPSLRKLIHNYKSLGHKKFISQFKKGVEGITPLQKERTNLIGYCIVLVGIVCGITTSILFHQWWLLIILLGSTFVSSTAFIGTYQKYLAFKKIEDMFKESEESEMKGGPEKSDIK